MKEKERKEILKRFICLTIFGIAMGLLEAIIVIYIREISQLQLTAFNSKYLLSLEWLRETSTILMLGIIGIVAGKNFLQRFFYFIYSFGIWDIFYYVFLKVIFDWPSSLLTWDILFLIPLPWRAPVLVPLISSLMMVILAISMVYLQTKNHSLKINFSEWGLLLGGASVISATFVWDSAKTIVQEKSFSSSLEIIPQNYNWTIFIIGCALLFLGIISIWRKYYKEGQ